MIKTILQENLCTVCGLDDKAPVVKTQYNAPREQMNPGELLAASLGACMLTMVGFMASRRNEQVAGTQALVEPKFDEKHSRIVSFTVTFVFPAELTQQQKDFYAKIAQTCPVHNSLREDISYTVIVK